MTLNLSSVEVETGPKPTACVIWLHGLGADGHDFEPIVPHLGLPDDLPVRFVFPNAPRIPVTINGGMVMRAWYDILEMRIEREVDETGIRNSAAAIEDLIAAERKRFAPDRIVLAGFSQGGAMTYHVGLRHREKLAGLLVLSAYLPLEASLAMEAAPVMKTVPILQCHGIYDPVVPHALGRASAQTVRARGYAIEWQEYPVAHSVHPNEVRDIGAWLVRVLRKPQAMTQP